MHRITLAGLVTIVAGSLLFSLSAAPSMKPEAAVTKVHMTAADYRQPPRAIERYKPIVRASRSYRPVAERAHAIVDRRIAHRAAVAHAKAVAARKARIAARIAARKARIARQHAAAAQSHRVASIGGGAGYTGMAVAIARCESGGDPSAQNPSSSASGLYQFTDGTWSAVTGLAPPASAYSAATQTAAFWKLWNGGAGAGNWAPSRGCWG